jgi:hypothetical protein
MVLRICREKESCSEKLRSFVGWHLEKLVGFPGSLAGSMRQAASLQFRRQCPFPSYWFASTAFRQRSTSSRNRCLALNRSCPFCSIISRSWPRAGTTYYPIMPTCSICGQSVAIRRWDLVFWTCSRCRRTRIARLVDSKYARRISIATSLLLTLVAVTLFAIPVADISPASCARIQAGMRVQDVERIIGAPPGFYDGLGGISTDSPPRKNGYLSWCGRRGEILVPYDARPPYLVQKAGFYPAKMIWWDPVDFVRERVTRRAGYPHADRRTFYVISLVLLWLGSTGLAICSSLRAKSAPAIPRV